MRYDIEAEPSKPRVREYVLAILCLALLVAYLESTDVSQQVIAERKSECELAKERAHQYATALAALLRRERITIGETTSVSCRVTHSEKS